LLTSYSYHGVLERGFALVRDETGAPVRSAKTLAAGAAISIEFADGTITARRDR
jgi:exodeoxyribonuclease VII large subunit